MVKIADVARHAGVSPSTVSYVLSGKRTISSQTRERVERAIRELGYRPHAGARALASSRSNILALMIPLRADVGVPVVMQFAVAAVTAARRHDHDVLLLTQEEGEDGLRRVVDGAIADGIIVMDVQLHDSRLPLLRSLEHPCVLIGVPADPAGLTCIDLDFHAASAACVAHLAQLGHRRIAMIGSPPQVYARETGFAQRVAAGFFDAATEYGIEATLDPCEPTAAAARDLADRLLAPGLGVTALIVHNEPILASLLSAASTCGRRVPEDLSVVAICPDEVAEHPHIPVTNVAVPATEIGERAVELLMDQLAGRTYPPQTWLPPTLTVRASTSATGGEPGARPR
ncbi:LacI family DNA-binding transcriptional regulator [Nocardia alni]|uniref:LacI family DNA-binding transcriptional regulator n=1 Tax=Nocardia alni TaxID=2815723 RepID=UPI001C23AE62|nr:LacI family DNA-binding transcriptional regulator [Nocardia alni]